MSFFQRFWGQIPISEKSKGLKIFRAFFNRVLHQFARLVPLTPGLRVFIHRLRGVKIGKNVFIGTDVFIDDAEPDLVIIEDEVTIIAQTTILAHSYYPFHLQRFLTSASQKKGVRLEKGCYLGLRSTVLPGIVIGSNAIVAAGSVVTKDVKPGTLVAGVPAKQIKRF
ncbi:galactoside O-acetyltransferase [Leptospira ryugenii]|uniref:Galactoside O-acetyltransferase n=1 Tax=Leptospira ryugenii TaxID=1917863 RepID=A0A2P2DVY0_9LEPT|nr:acyltransferase [Leptospira ryugenii]GBF48798.1 galactoside O-acetyltransferase [Leptospira ryugenii]